MRVASKTKRIGTRLLMACTAGVVSGLFAHGVDQLLAARAVNPHCTVVDDLVTAVFVGSIALFLSLYLDNRNERQHTRHRVLAVAEMNHHLRNALAVLKLSSDIEDSLARRRAIESGIARIEFTLEEILPSSFDRGGEPRYFVGPQHED